MSSTIVSLLSKLSYLNTSLVFETSTGGFVLDIHPNGEYCAEFGYPIERVILCNTDQFIGFIKTMNINSVMLLNHETDEETTVYP
jgi:hypothetical protein